MAVCNFPQTSSPIGQASTSCLRKFTIHFRRPDKLKQNQNAPYRGEYGFDWLRDEYIYPIETVAVNIFSKLPIDQNKPTPLCSTVDIPMLKNEYLKDVAPSGKEFKPHGQDYYPAWLSIFACNLQGNNADKGSEMHKDGVYLDLQLDEIDKIIDDGTEIFFKPSDPCLKITPEKISISEFLKTTREKRILDNNAGQPEIHYYLLENAVKIICQGDTLKQHGEIKVFAKLGSDEYEVGRLKVYKNDSIGKAEIVVINVITEDAQNNKIYPKSHPSLEDLYNYKSFNQAMIKVEIKAIEDFDLVALKKNNDVKNFIKDINDPNYIDGRRPNPNYIYGTNQSSYIEPDKDITNRLCALYEKYGKHLPKNNQKINNGGHFNTYLFFIDLAPYNNEVGGNTALANKIWGNMFVIFKKGLTDDHTLVHEAAHSFSLTHIFEPLLKPTFHKGYTENFMDDNFYLKSTSPTLVMPPNKYNGKIYSFFKRQWDTMRKDKSIKIMKRNK